MSKKVITGEVRDEVVDTHGGDITYDLELDGNSIDSLFRSYKGQNIRVTIEVVEDEKMTDIEWEDD